MSAGSKPRFVGRNEDQAFLVKIFLKHAVFVTDECLDLYRQHPDSCCAQAIARGDYHPARPHPARRVFLNWMAKYLFLRRGAGSGDLAGAREGAEALSARLPRARAGRARPQAS